jgi:hypothetical protein
VREVRCDPLQAAHVLLRCARVHLPGVRCQCVTRGGCEHCTCDPKSSRERRAFWFGLVGVILIAALILAAAFGFWYAVLRHVGP